MHYIGQFGLGVGLNTVVFIVFLLKMDVAPINATLIVCHTWDIDDPVTRIEIALGLNLRAAIWLFFFNYGLGRAWKMQKTRHCWRCCKPLLKRDRIHLCIFSDSLILSLSSFENHKKCHTLKWSKKCIFIIKIIWVIFKPWFASFDLLWSCEKINSFQTKKEEG